MSSGLYSGAAHPHSLPQDEFIVKLSATQGSPVEAVEIAQKIAGSLTDGEALFRLSDGSFVAVITEQKEPDPPYDSEAAQRLVAARKVDLEIQRIEQRANDEYAARRGSQWTWECSPFNPNRPYHTKLD